MGAVHNTIERMAKDRTIAILTEFRDEIAHYVKPAVCIAIPDDYDPKISEAAFSAEQRERGLWLEMIDRRITELGETK